MSMSYAGVQLMVPLPEHVQLVESMFRPEEMAEFDRPAAPQFGQEHLSQTKAFERRLRLNTLHWPVGASNWARFHFLASENQLAKIRRTVYPSSGYSAATLTLNDEKFQISTSMWLLPPRHVAQVDGCNDLLLCTLVDDRYFWWEQAGDISVDAPLTAWLELYESIGTALGIAIAVDTVARNYLTPSADWASSYQYLPTLLDAVAASCGQRVVRTLAGQVKTQNATTALASVNAQTTSAARLCRLGAGGGMALSVLTNSTDLPAAVPTSVTIAFPRSDSGTLGNLTTAYTVTLASLNLPEFRGVRTGYPGSKVFRANTIAYWTGGGSADNDAELTTLAEQIATDFYRWRLGRLDACFARIVPWAPEGFHSIEWTWSAVDGMNTFVRRGPWIDQLELVGVVGSFGAVNRAEPTAASGGGEVVYSNSWLNQGSDLALTTIYTPTEDGLYQLCTYQENPTNDAGAGTVVTGVTYTDDVGNVASASLNNLPLNVAWVPTWVLPVNLRLKADQPLQIDVTGGGTYGTATWSLFVSIMRVDQVGGGGGSSLPATVASGSFLNQGADLAQTTLFTPAAGGIYRLSVYWRVPTFDVTSAGPNLSIQWTDDVDFGNYHINDIDMTQVWSSSRVLEYCAPVFLAAGTPISMSVQGGTYGTATYSINWSIEKVS